MLCSNDLFQFDLDVSHNSVVITKIKTNNLEEIVLPSAIEYEGISYKIEFIEIDAFRTMNKNSILYIDFDTQIKRHIWGLHKKAMAATEYLDPYVREDLKFYIKSRIRYKNQIPILCKEDNKVLLGNIEFSICKDEDEQYLTLEKFRSRFELYDNFKTHGIVQIDGTSIPHNVELVLPEALSVGNKKIQLKKIAPFAFSCAGEIGSVVMPKSVISIGEKAFYGCACLRKVYIPSSVKSIGDFAFSAYVQEYDQPCGYLEEVINDSDAPLPKDVFWGQEYNLITHPAYY